MMIGTLIQHEYLVVRDWPLGSAFSFVLMALGLGGVVVYLKVEKAKRSLVNGAHIVQINSERLMNDH